MVVQLRHERVCKRLPERLLENVFEQTTNNTQITNKHRNSLRITHKQHANTHKLHTVTPTTHKQHTNYTKPWAIYTSVVRMQPRFYFHRHWALGAVFTIERTLLERNISCLANTCVLFAHVKAECIICSWFNNKTLGVVHVFLQTLKDYKHHLFSLRQKVYFKISSLI